MTVNDLSTHRIASENTSS